ncbi:PEP-CTERM sorting domain-containing protein [Methyloversatilis sp.]|uniref:PEP-CTERM sorting domain-containing protein n=1 Tax=Methyloversatilis sp. TaxID=2569862 RepID=UPI0027357C48|nr:PEP-CTERM sorting domain-containing protein [Methyloversatilis sp.]MDP2868924.1 PEP-CTERM sorting domain-containing protein [Methyloversatilis sp.]MDP3456389.1 PEP-CTERM sorting domain-containing protein [Methyloversatilis sp.]MDP3577753.1 PEP-CTERM sorting domain-containing protein [Methyloversatilis sp.]
MSVLPRLAVALLMLHAVSVQAQHVDVAISLDKGPVSGSQLIIGAFGDLPFDIQPLDHLTGHALFPANFGDFEGGPKSTDDPGFQAFAGALSGSAGARDYIGFRALGTLQQWTPSSGAWTTADSGVGVRLFGAVPPAVANAYIQSLINPRLAPPGAAAAFNLYSAGTLFSGSGITGPVTATIDDAGSNGAFHAHLDWYLEGAAATGAYMVTLQLTDAASVGGRGLYVDSDPFHVVFNYGLSMPQYETAFLARALAPVPEPAAWMAMLAGLCLCAAAARRARA